MKLTDETGAGAGARGTVVHAVWTRPDGSSFDQYANIGTRLRAEFRLYTAGEPGIYTLTVAGATKAGYAFDPTNSALLSEYIQIGNPTNQPPIAIFNVDARDGSAPLTVNFDSSGSGDPDGTVESYEWAFGDGNYATGMYQSHTYTDVGNFVATLTVTDDMGATASHSIPIAVTDSTAGCINGCISVDRIAMSYKAKAGKVKGRVWLLDENERSVKDATVHALWTLPDSSTVDQYRDTGAKSRANFSLRAKIPGTYTLTIIEVDKPGYAFDLDTSNVLDGKIDIAP